MEKFVDFIRAPMPSPEADALSWLGKLDGVLERNFADLMNSIRGIERSLNELEDRLNQLLHGGAYHTTSDQTTTITGATTWTPAVGALTAVGNNSGFDLDATNLKVTHNHTEPTGTTHYYDIHLNAHLAGGNNDVISARLRWYDSSEATTTTIWEGTVEVIQTPGANYHAWINAETRAALENGDTVALELYQASGTNNITIYSGATLLVRGT